MIEEDILAGLSRRRDEKYLAFQSALIPTVPRDSFIGVRTPDLRAMAKEFSKRPDVNDFLRALPHRYFDQNQLHAFIISGNEDFYACLA